MDVSLLLEGLKRDDTQVGAWVNVIGYVEGISREKIGAEHRMMDIEKGRHASHHNEMIRVKVKAIMLWSAGALKIGEYERALEERLQVKAGSA